MPDSFNDEKYSNVMLAFLSIPACLEIVFIPSDDIEITSWHIAEGSSFAFITKPEV